MDLEQFFSMSLLFLVLLSVTLTAVQVESKNFSLLSSNECMCPNYTLTYECTVVGTNGGEIIWTGSAFNCHNRSPEIVLFYNSNETQTCNSGAIAVWSDGISNSNSFTSLLNVTISPDMIGKSIECQHEDSRGISLVGSSIIGGNISHIQSIDGSQISLIFNWSRISPFSSCPIHNTSVSNCGQCPHVTNDTTGIKCTDVPTRGVCTFSLWFDVCGVYIGNITTIPLGPGFRPVGLLPTLISIVIIVLLIVTLVGATLLITSCKRSKRLCPCADDRSQSNAVSMKCRTRTGLHDSEVDTNVYENISTVKIFDNKSASGIYGCADEEPRAQYEDFIPTIEEGVLDLDSLLVYLRGRVTFQWYKFGSSLGVPSNTLEKFVKESEKYSEEKALNEVLEYWLKNHPTEPTWKEVASALRDVIQSI